MSNDEFVSLHLHDDVLSLALKKMPPEVDATWCLQQIEGWQTACRKLPSWAQTAGLWFPPRLSMEQCSSEQTARYKCEVVKRLLPQGENRTNMADLTGGFGIDFSFLAQLFQKAIYVERLPHLCDIARHNFPVLGLQHTQVLNMEIGEGAEIEDVLPTCDLLYLDPARRDNAGHKTVAISDCTPDVAMLQDKLLSRARYVMVKLSPMLDISAALSVLRHVIEIHVVSVKGECKELLVVMGEGTGITCHCVNLESKDAAFIHQSDNAEQPAMAYADGLETYLYEPNASILKAGLQNHAAAHYGVKKLHPNSNLFTSSSLVPDFPGRAFFVDEMGDFSKKRLRALLSDVKKANLTVRNFPVTVAELRKRLKLPEGGEVYLFATTLRDGSHVIIRGRAISSDARSS